MRYMITHSLLSAWLYLLKENPFETAESESDPMKDFLDVLNRVPTPTTEAMQKGIDFENLVTAICKGAGNIEDKNYSAAEKVARVVKGGCFQYATSSTMKINGIEVFLYGRLDVLKAGTIYDIKYSGSYERGKFENSTQHPTYFELIPEADKFVYLISNGDEVWTETYYREDTRSIRPIISDFFDWLKAYDLLDLYKEKWVSK